MKKILTALLALALLLGLTGCGHYVSLLPGVRVDTDALLAEEGEAAQSPDGEGFAAQSLYDFMGWGQFGEEYYSNTPVAVSFQYNGGAEGCVSPVFDRSSIIAVCDALRSMTVTGKTAEGDHADEKVFIFTMADGETRSVTFDHGNLSMYTGEYTVEGGEELFAVAFPAYNSDFDVFDLYFDESMRAFADGFYENTPVSVSRRANGGATITSTDPETVTAVFEALRGASVSLVENSPDQFVDVTAVRDYIFTMADGSAYTFSFAQQCLVVRVNAVYGPVYYWLGNIDPLWDIDIEPENTGGQFEGGTVRELREDIEPAAAIANGERDDLDIIGVHVSYDIDGESGYLTLSDELADSMVRTVTGISVSGERVDEPAGDIITVSVTLSDWSGPIFYFTGDTIQQVIGSNYRCDSDEISMLRSTVLDLAAEGHANVEVDD